jgi:hypothetical protein
LGVELGKMKFDGKFDAPAKRRRTSAIELMGLSTASNLGVELRIFSTRVKPIK